MIVKTLTLCLTLLVLPVAAIARTQATEAATAQEPSVMRDDDARMTCGQISDEAATLSQGMAGPHGGVFHTLSGVARSGVALLIPGAGLAMAGADVATQGSRDRREARADDGEHRWYYLNGLYIGRGCQRQAEADEAPTGSPPQASPSVPPASH